MGNYLNTDCLYPKDDLFISSDNIYSIESFKNFRKSKKYSEAIKKPNRGLSIFIGDALTYYIMYKEGFKLTEEEYQFFMFDDVGKSTLFTIAEELEDVTLIEKLLKEPNFPGFMKRQLTVITDEHYENDRG